MGNSRKYALFINSIQAAITVAAIERRRGPEWAAGVMVEALCVPEDALPDDLAKVGHMVLEFLEWQCGPDSEAEPEWYDGDWIGDEW